MKDERELNGEPYPIANEIPLEPTPTIQNPPAQLPQANGGEQTVMDGQPPVMGGEQLPLPVQPEPRAGINSIGLSPEIKADIVEDTIEANPKESADVLPDKGPLADLNKEAEQAIDGGKDAEVRNDVVEKSLDDLDFEAFVESVENGTNVNNKLDSLVNNLNVDPLTKNDIKNKAISKFETGNSNNLNELADYLEENIDKMNPDDYGEFVEKAVDAMGYTLKDNDKKTELQTERFNDDPDLLIDRLRWASQWAQNKKNASNTDALQDLLDSGKISEEDLEQAVYDASEQERREQANKEGQEWAESQILKTRNGMLSEPDLDAVLDDYNKRSDAAAKIYGFNEDIPLTKEQEKLLKEENKRKNEIEKEEFRQAANAAVINARNKFGKYYEEYQDSKWAERIEQMINTADAELLWKDQIDVGVDDIDKPFNDTPARVAFAELKENLDKDIEISPEEKEKVEDILDDLEIAFGKGAPIGDVKSGALNDEFERSKRVQSAGSSFKGFKPIMSSGGFGHSIARGKPLSASQSNVKAINNSGAAKVANDVTARKEYKNNSIIKPVSSTPKTNNANTRNGSVMSSGVNKTKGGKLLGVKGVKLPSGGGHTSAQTGKLDLPKGSGKLSKVSQNLTLASLKARIISAAQSWPEKNGFRDSEDRLGSIQLLVKDTDVWVGSGVTKGRIKLENAIKKEPQLAQLIRSELQ